MPVKKRPIATLRMKSIRKLGDFILKIRSIVFDIGQNAAYFTTPSPALATVSGHVDDLENAENAAQARTAGAVQVRDVKLDIVKQDANALLMYVQLIVDATADIDLAIAIISASGFEVKGVRSVGREAFAVTNTDIPGKVELTAKVVKGTSAHIWNYSTDNGATWVQLPVTIQGKTTADGFVSGAKVSFRHRTVTRAGEQAWSQIVTVVIL